MSDKPLYIEKQDQWLSWLLLRIGETGRFVEAFAQFYASILEETTSEATIDILGELEALIGKIRDLHSHPDRIWVELLPGGGQGADEHNAWSEALEAVTTVAYSPKEIVAKEQEELSEFNVILLAPGLPPTRALTEVQERTRKERSILELMHLLTDQRYHVVWNIDPIPAEYMIVTENGQQWIFSRTDAKILEGLVNMAADDMDVDPDDQYKERVMYDARDRAVYFAEHGEMP